LQANPNTFISAFRVHDHRLCIQELIEDISSCFDWFYCPVVAVCLFFSLAKFPLPVGYWRF